MATDKNHYDSRDVKEGAEWHLLVSTDGHVQLHRLLNKKGTVVVSRKMNF